MFKKAGNKSWTRPIQPRPCINKTMKSVLALLLPRIRTMVHVSHGAENLQKFDDCENCPYFLSFAYKVQNLPSNVLSYTV